MQIDSQSKTNSYSSFMFRVLIFALPEGSLEWRQQRMMEELLVLANDVVKHCREFLKLHHPSRAEGIQLVITWNQIKEPTKIQQQALSPAGHWLLNVKLKLIKSAL